MSEAGRGCRGIGGGRWTWRLSTLGPSPGSQHSTGRGKGASQGQQGMFRGQHGVSEGQWGMAGGLGA